ncbi:probable FBD-associated F-box protein At1g32375 [Lotus japonicus]|uniref:probable FBD-associated F-box protein At1g32375 n=1 Tax=Lotus japonicus TaxID=34305 RepID=UPI002582959A|nr:probable FBD-associated F-box protein At1g32375 [Lotus japonicus]
MPKKMPPMDDRLSDLPDEILLNILSFLPTEVAFTTTVLSKRWTPLFYSLTALDFDDEAEEDEENYIHFRRFVDNVLLSPRVQHHPIETLSLASHFKLGNDRSWFKTDEWIEAAKRRHVKNLQLSTTYFLLHLLPGSVFTSSKTLVVLKLRNIIMDHCVGSVDLPSLTTLHLIYVIFRGQREDLKKILNGSPNVEDLIVLGPCFGDPILIGGFKTLPKVVKAHINALNIPFSAIPNVEFLHIEDMERRHNDKYINSYYREMPVFRNLMSLKLTFLHFPSWVRVMEVLPYCPKLQSLAIKKLLYTQQNYEEQWAHTTELVPECVSLHLTTCSIESYKIKDMYDDFDFAAYILKNARVLQVLTLHISDSKESEKIDQLFKHLSGCSRISPACKIECAISS